MYESEYLKKKSEYLEWESTSNRFWKTDKYHKHKT